MSELVFLLEEPSMKVLLDDLLPRFYPTLSFRCIPHEGKQDLERSIPRLLRAWKVPGARFVIVRDKDQEDCVKVKERLVALCREGRRPDALVRIVCQELEAWYFGDCEALATAYTDDRLRTLGGRERYRDPDAIVRPSFELTKAVPEFQKRLGARRMAATMRRDGNTSYSFRVFFEGIERVAGDGLIDSGQEGI